jgi:hypothetical protein
LSTHSAHRRRWTYQLHALAALYSQQTIFCLYYPFLLDAEETSDSSAAGVIGILIEYIYPMETRTHNLPVCSIKPTTAVIRSVHDHQSIQKWLLGGKPLQSRSSLICAFGHTQLLDRKVFNA